MNTEVGEIPQVRTKLDWGDRVGRWQMRWGLGRMRYRIAPGLYAVGRPDPQSPVLVTANYKMSFDALRCELKGRHLWILVLETQGINVWCAAGKGTFGTDELVRRIRATGLERLVSHRRLILPQLGAVGVAAHEVRKQSGFQVIYGPVRAADLPALLNGGEKAVTLGMRRVEFPLGERLALTPVELVSMGKITLWAVLILLVLAGIGPGIFSFSAAFSRGTTAVAVYLVGVFAGAVLTPLLLPWLPWRAFSAKGALVGAGLALVILIASSGVGLFNTLALILSLAAVSSYCAMNFTGSTTFTSPSGVEKEMRRAIPLQAGALLLAGIFWLGSGF
ncbi:acetyl-CoA synthase subunit gamma [Geoalkalibacter halelectricus]|uniref:Acetyl-CoA synthase subunit gamma n=2 Tax=Geoalkalibacter halelectricus TaxID=2847045 RepID=A0ABY5ZGI7_9BACT|nr:mercury methylation corrinoid protein HgcA [Geoalkalibacter halelectricus]UWZ78211.1 acetyl-CoA synthase subunit gamma [Geoalkalibacter halelectricus]